MTSDIDHIVHTAHDKDVSFPINISAIASEVISREWFKIGLEKAIIRLSQGRERSRRKRKFDRDQAFLFGTELFSPGIEDLYVEPRHRLC